MKRHTRRLILVLLVFSASLYAKSTPIKPPTSIIKKEFLKVPKKIVKMETINLIKPVSNPPDEEIDFKEFFSLLP
jgi:hypothetical protein